MRLHPRREYRRETEIWRGARLLALCLRRTAMSQSPARAMCAKRWSRQCSRCPFDECPRREKCEPADIQKGWSPEYSQCSPIAECGPRFILAESTRIARSLYRASRRATTGFGTEKIHGLSSYQTPALAGCPISPEASRSVGSGRLFSPSQESRSLPGSSRFFVIQFCPIPPSPRSNVACRDGLRGQCRLWPLPH